MFELPTYFILPLTRLNFKDFGKFQRSEWNLKSTKINLQEKYIKIEVFDIVLLPKGVLDNENFIKIVKPNSILLNIPTTISKTLRYFERGQYSKFPDSIKNWIKVYSGLPKTHDYIQALYKSDKLRKKLENELGVSLSKGAELLEAPKDKWFIVEQEKEEV